MQFKNKELIIFDFDGTLINSIPDLTLALNKMLNHYNLAPLSIEQVTPFIGNGAKLLVHRALEKSMGEKQVTDQLFNEAFKIYLEAYKKDTCVETYLYPGVFETLQYLHKKGYTLAICTNKPYAFIESILVKLQIKTFFSSWIGEDSLPEKKPSAAPLIYLAEKAKTTIEKSLMVGDSKNDILAAKNAKMESIGVSYGYNYNENIADYNPTVAVDNFADLQDLL